jgi:surface protein
MSDTLKQIAENYGAGLVNGSYLNGIAEAIGVDLSTSTDIMADILTASGGYPENSTDYLKDIVLVLGGVEPVNGNWMEAWEAITAAPALFTTEWTTTANSESITLPYTASGTYSGTIDWGDGNTDVNDGTVTTHTYATAGTYTVIIDGDCIGCDFNTAGGSTYFTSVVNWGQLQLGPDNYGYNFAFCPNLDLSSVQGTLDLTGVTNLDGLFYDCTSLTAINNINSWDTSAITSMVEMFSACFVFNQALSFDTSAVESMIFMFADCQVFNQPINFNTSAVTNMDSMFKGCLVFNQPLSFNTSAVNDMTSMFYDAPAFNQNIGAWNVENVIAFRYFMDTKTPATFSTTNLNAIYNGWSTQAVQSELDISFGTAKYTGAATAGRLVLTGRKLWTITDGGL